MKKPDVNQRGKRKLMPVNTAESKKPDVKLNLLKLISTPEHNTTNRQIYLHRNLAWLSVRHTIEIPF